MPGDQVGVDLDARDRRLSTGVERRVQQAGRGACRSSATLPLSCSGVTRSFDHVGERDVGKLQRFAAVGHQRARACRRPESCSGPTAATPGPSCCLVAECRLDRRLRRPAGEQRAHHRRATALRSTRRRTRASIGTRRTHAVEVDERVEMPGAGGTFSWIDRQVAGVADPAGKRDIAPGERALRQHRRPESRWRATARRSQLK